MSDHTYLAFDIDGTIYDSTEIVVEAFHRGIVNFIKKYKVEDIVIPGYDDLLDLLGIPVDDIFKTLFPGLSSDDSQKLNDECTGSLIAEIRNGGGIIFDHVYSTMEKLYNSGYAILTASNGRREYVEAILETYDLKKFFSEPMIYTGKGIPDKISVVRYYIKNVVNDDLIIVIGDRYTDREAAFKNGVPFIGCSFGHAGDTELKGEKWVADSFDKIPEAVEDIRRNFNEKN